MLYQIQNNKDTNLLATPTNSQDVIPLGNQAQLDLFNTSRGEFQTSLKKHLPRDKIDLANKMQELGIDNHQTIGKMSQQVSMASSVDASATITGAYNDKMGLNRSNHGKHGNCCKGEMDRSCTRRAINIFYVVVAAIKIVIVAALVMGK